MYMYTYVYIYIYMHIYIYIYIVCDALDSLVFLSSAPKSHISLRPIFVLGSWISKGLTQAES